MHIGQIGTNQVLQGIIMQGILHMNLPMSYWDIYRDTTYEFTHFLLGHLPLVK